MNDDQNQMAEGQAQGDPSALEGKGVGPEDLQAGETPQGLDSQPVAADELEAAEEAPPVRYDEDLSTASPTSGVPPHFPQGEQKGFQRPDGALPAAVRSAERVKSRSAKQKVQARRAARA